MDGLTFWIVAIIASFAVGLGKGGVPVVTATAVPVMSLVISPILAAGLLLPIYIASDAMGLYAYRKHFNRQVLKILCTAMPFGVAIGWATSSYVSEAVVTALIGLIGASFALSMILRKPVTGAPIQPRWRPGLFWGLITGFTSFVSHSGATPFQVYVLPLRLDKLTFAGTVAVAFAYINLVKLIPYYALGQLSLDNLRTTAILLIPAITGVLAGVRLVRILPEKRFFQIIIWALLLLSLKLIWDGVRSMFL